MGKKIPILISTLMISISALVPRAPVFAEERPKLWSLDEIAALKVKTDAEDELICAGNWECKDNLRFGRLDSGEPIYWALEALEMSNLLITSINPSTETISLYFQDEDLMMKRMGIDEPHQLTEAYMFWLEDGMLGPAKDTIDIYNYSEAVKNEQEISGLHPLISKNEEKNGADWLPYRTEVEYSVAGSNLLENREGIIYFTVNADGLIIGLKDYSKCLNSPDYTEGMECRLMFDDSGYYAYIPTVPASIEPTADEQPAALDDILPASEDSTGYGKTGAISNLDQELPKAPNTGTINSEHEASEDFPWWLFLLIFLNSLPIIWLFWPEPSKSPKKSKKSIDKSIASR